MTQVRTTVFSDPHASLAERPERAARADADRLPMA